MGKQSIEVGGVLFGIHAAEVLQGVAATSAGQAAEVEADLRRASDGVSRREMLAGCLDGVEDASTKQGWEDYVDSIFAHTERAA